MDARLEALRPELPKSPAAATEQRGVFERLRGIRGKVGAALIALTTGTGVAEKSDAATIMMQGEIVPASEVTEKPKYALALTNDSFFYDIGHADGTADATMSWFSIESTNGTTLERYVDMGGDVPSTVIAPDLLNDGNESSFFLTIADLPELSSLHYALDSDAPDDQNISLHRFLSGAFLRAGFGPLTGNPQNPDEAVAMTNGPVVEAFYQENVELDDAWIFHNVTPEPSTFGLAAVGIAGAGLTSRRRFKQTLRK